MEETSLDQFLDAGEDSSDSSEESEDPSDEPESQSNELESQSNEPENQSNELEGSTTGNSNHQSSRAPTDDTANAGTGKREELSSEDVDESEGSVVDPATTTSRWRARAIACATCGAETNRLWFEGEDAVCPSCKEW